MMNKTLKVFFNWFLPASTLVLSSCARNGAPFDGCKELFAMEPQTNPVLVWSFDNEYEVIIPKGIGDVKVLSLWPDNLNYEIGDTTINLIPKSDRYLKDIGKYPFVLEVQYDGCKETIRGQFEIARQEVRMGSFLMNFLITNEENDVLVSAGKFGVERCSLSSEDSVRIIKKSDFLYGITPYEEGPLEIELSGLINGEIIPLGRMRFISTTGDQTINSLMDQVTNGSKQEN